MYFDKRVRIICQQSACVCAEDRVVIETESEKSTIPCNDTHQIWMNCKPKKKQTNQWMNQPTTVAEIRFRSRLNWNDRDEICCLNRVNLKIWSLLVISGINNCRRKYMMDYSNQLESLKYNFGTFKNFQKFLTCSHEIWISSTLKTTDFIFLRSKFN